MKRGTTFAFNLRFPGQYYDVETAKHYNYFRDYDPAIGRYIESDPIGLRGGINTYAYVRGRPLNLIDRLGLRAQMCCKMIVPGFAGSMLHGFILEAIAEKTYRAERRTDLHEAAEERYSGFLASGKTIPWEKMRGYLEARIAGERVPRPKVAKRSR